MISTMAEKLFYYNSCSHFLDIYDREKGIAILWRLSGLISMCPKIPIWNTNQRYTSLSHSSSKTQQLFLVQLRDCLSGDVPVSHIHLSTPQQRRNSFTETPWQLHRWYSRWRCETTLGRSPGSTNQLETQQKIWMYCLMNSEPWFQKLKNGWLKRGDNNQNRGLVPGVGRLCFS